MLIVLSIDDSIKKKRSHRVVFRAHTIYPSSIAKFWLDCGSFFRQVEEILAARGDPAPHKTTAFMKKKCGNNFLMLNIESVAAVGRLEELAVR